MEGRGGGYDRREGGREGGRRWVGGGQPNDKHDDRGSKEKIDKHE